ncbi:MAG TPA: 3-isopropylmalate dehydratase [Tepidisphaeraceae bacterium]|nr:3-isopropylmalate dehydratase [Tepidisphaeraceae bacterium]
MQQIINGKAYVLGDNIDTDQIIPAEYLSYNPADPKERKYFGMYANSGVPEAQAGLPHGQVKFVRTNEFRSDYNIIVGGKNFGCGSSREHAPLALAEAGVVAVIAEFYARIFYRNSINGGYLLPLESTQRLLEHIETGDELTIDLKAGTVTNNTKTKSFTLNPLGEVLPIIEAGGVFEYAKEVGMLK